MTEPLEQECSSSPVRPTADGDSESPYPETQPDDEGRAGMGVPRLQWPWWRLQVLNRYWTERFTASKTWLSIWWTIFVQTDCCNLLNHKSSKVYLSFFISVICFNDHSLSFLRFFMFHSKVAFSRFVQKLRSFSLFWWIGIFYIILFCRKSKQRK